MNLNEKIAATLAAATRKLVGLMVKLHCRQLEGVKRAAQAKVSKAYSRADAARSAEYAAKESWRMASADRRIAVQDAVATARAASPTILAADGEIARYNG